MFKLDALIVSDNITVVNKGLPLVFPLVRREGLLVYVEIGQNHISQHKNYYR